MGGIYEVDKASGGSVIRTVTYYPVAGAMRINSTLYYVLKDHLGSASVVTDASGNIVGENRYYPFGETRLSTGSIFTDKLYTGQREMAGLGIYHYQARFYSPKLGRFLSPDTIIPEFANPQSWNRYSYVYNNPIRYNDPTGHCPVCAVPIVAADVALMVGVTLFVTALLLPPVHDALVDNITNGIEALQVKTKKPLTKDEEKKIKHLGEDSENFLREHPDLKKEAQKKAKGEENEYDHVGEAEDWVRGLENDKRHLQRVRDLRNKEAQQAIDRAIEKGQKWINQIIRKLYGKE